MNFKINLRKYNNSIFYTLLCLMGCIYGVFYAKYVFYGNDMPLHTEFARLLFTDGLKDAPTGVPQQAVAYPVYHIILKLFHYLFGFSYETAAAIVLSTSVIISILLFRTLMQYVMNSKQIKDLIFADVVSIGAVIFVTARCWLNDWRYYQFQGAANPVHNPTTTFVRPFGIISFLAFLIFIEKYQKNEKFLKFLFTFSVISCLSTAVKPSFAFVFLPALGIYTLIRMIKNKEIKIGIYSFLGVLPTLLFLLWQQIYVTDNTGMLKIRIIFGSFSNFTLPQVICVSLVTFPVPILLFRKKLFQINETYLVAMMALLIGWIQMFFLSNGGSGDFSWGYDLSVQFATVVALAASRTLKEENHFLKYVRYIAYVIFIYQVFSGVQYMMMAYETGGFWF